LTPTEGLEAHSDSRLQLTDEQAGYPIGGLLGKRNGRHSQRIAEGLLNLTGKSEAADLDDLVLSRTQRRIEIQDLIIWRPK
jgi:hypothetical protein